MTEEIIDEKPNLKSVLDGNIEEIEVSVQPQYAENQIVNGNCIECSDQPSVLFCEQCMDDYCEVCFAAQHRRGNRSKHTLKKLVTEPKAEKTIVESNGLKASIIRAFSSKKVILDSPMENESTEELIISAHEYLQTLPASSANHSFLERAKFIPLRLSYEERKYLRLLEAGLAVCEYTDKIDVVSYSNKNKRVVAQIKELCSILSGLVLAADYKTGQSLFKDKDFAHNQQFFQDIFELGRRHKIMNPEKMRDSYGKLVYMLQDSAVQEVSEMLEFKCIKPVVTVYSVLEAGGALAVLNDQVIEVATQEIKEHGRKRPDIQKDIRAKERAIEYLAKKYKTSSIDSETIRQCLYSVGDNNAFLRTNYDPCVQMIEYLKEYFNPKSFEQGFSLGIQAGRDGARLSHGHEKQYQYVIQSLSLWKEILHDMFKLWMMAESDLLDDVNYYRLRDTGQGLNRVQAAPRVSRMMHGILHRAQQSVGSWVGSSVIHLGDHNVPNALMFIDKYTQIYRILLPIVTTIRKIDTLNSPTMIQYIKNAFGSHREAKRTILLDFFRHGFDGSGADNFFDAGSCIDGRLTSAWNWCSQLEKKEYFPIFLLTGFVGFDGQF